MLLLPCWSWRHWENNSEGDDGVIKAKPSQNLATRQQQAQWVLPILRLLTEGITAPIAYPNFHGVYILLVSCSGKQQFLMLAVATGMV